MKYKELKEELDKLFYDDDEIHPHGEIGCVFFYKDIPGGGTLGIPFYEPPEDVRHYGRIYAISHGIPFRDTDNA